MDGTELFRSVRTLKEKYKNGSKFTHFLYLSAFIFEIAKIRQELALFQRKKVQLDQI